MENKIIVAVVGVVYDRKGRILLSLRQDKESPETNLKWEFPGGELKFGETATECLIREVRQETGYLVEPQQVVDLIWSNIFDIPAEARKIQVIVIPFMCQVMGGPFYKESDEALEVKWFNPSAIAKLDTLPGVKEIVTSALKYLRRSSNDGL